MPRKPKKTVTLIFAKLGANGEKKVTPAEVDKAKAELEAAGFSVVVIVE